MYTVKNRAQNEIKIKKSKFIATIFPVSSLKEAKKRRDEIKTELKNATHYPYGLRIGHKRIVERFSDDGEPPKSSGFPILQVLKNAALTNTLIIVTRYFGGIKLGLGGLSRAYRESASSVLDNVKKEHSVPLLTLKLSTDKLSAGKIRYILTRFGARILKENYGNRFYYIIEIKESQRKKLSLTLKNITKGEISIQKITALEKENV